MVLLALATVLVSQAPAPPYQNGNLLSLLERSDVQEELLVSRGQKEQLARLLLWYYGRMDAIAAAADPYTYPHQDLVWRKQQYEILNAQIIQHLSQILKPAQASRGYELVMQRLGHRALAEYRPLQLFLGMDDFQVLDVKAVFREYQANHYVGINDLDTMEQVYEKEQRRQIWEQSLWNDLRPILSDEQAHAYVKARGAPFKFKPERHGL